MTRDAKNSLATRLILIMRGGRDGGDTESRGRTNRIDVHIGHELCYHKFASRDTLRSKKPMSYFEAGHPDLA